MNGLSKDIDLKFLLGRQLIQLAVGVYQVIFHFDGDVSISVEGQFDCTHESSRLEWQAGSPLKAAIALGMIGATVEDVTGKGDGTLELKFSNGGRLVIRDLNAQYESYQISKPGETIVV